MNRKTGLQKFLCSRFVADVRRILYMDPWSVLRAIRMACVFVFYMTISVFVAVILPQWDMYYPTLIKLANMLR